MKKTEKDLLVQIAKDLIELNQKGQLTSKALEEVKESFQAIMPENEEWDKILNDNFESFLKHVADAHKGTKDQRSGCEPCQGTTKCEKDQEEEENEFDYIFTVFLKDGSRVEVEGNSLLERDLNLTIFFDDHKKDVKASFRDFVGYIITLIKEEEC